jgi:hypothetical protein
MPSPSRPRGRDSHKHNLLVALKEEKSITQISSGLQKGAGVNMSWRHCQSRGANDDDFPVIRVRTFKNAVLFHLFLFYLGF